MDSNLSKFKKRPAVITIPDLLTPGISDNIWNKPISKIDIIFRSLSIFFSTLNLSATHSRIANIKVVHAIISILLKRFINPVIYKIAPKKIVGKEPNIIKYNNFLFLVIFFKSFLK